MKRVFKNTHLIFWAIWTKYITTRINLVINNRKSSRYLEIGSGSERIPGYETLNILPGKDVDYVLDCSKKLPFRKQTFELIYASHVLEHVPWYMVQQTLNEWVRILKRGGRLEVWVPDGVKVCKAFVDAELYQDNYIHRDGWYKFNPEKDPCVWAAGRIYTYGDGRGSPKSPNWHRSLFSVRYLKLVMERAGLVDIGTLAKEDIRGHDHGWINLGIKGTKP